MVLQRALYLVFRRIKLFFMTYHRFVRIAAFFVLVAFFVLNTNVAAVGAKNASPKTESVRSSHHWQKSGRRLQGISSQQLNYATNHIVVGKNDGSVTTVPVSSADQITDTLTYWRKQPGVKYAEVDNKVQAYGQQTTWGYNTVKANAALSSNTATGEGVVVAVIDTGVDYNHEDLSANAWVNTDEIASNNIDDDNNGYVDDRLGYDFIGHSPLNLVPDSDPIDDNGHGTHVAGIIAAANNTIGVKGVAIQAQILPVKVLDGYGYGYDYTVAQGIRYAVDNGAHIINLSLGSTEASTALKSAVDYATNNGVVVVAAAGNSGSFTFPSYPAAYSNVISVAASNKDGEREYYSNAGKIDVIAPGGAILSTTLGDTYAKYSGTSMAAPFVSGVAALIRQKQGVTSWQGIRHIIQTTATDFSLQTGPDIVSGYGMVNAQAATGTLANTTTMMYSDSSWIKSDGNDAAVLTVSVRTNTGVAVSGTTVTWSTSAGTLSTTSSTTDSNGLTSATLTADDTSGIITVTAQPAGVTSATAQVIVMTDIPQAESIGMSKVITSVSTDDSTSDSVGTSSSVSSNMVAAGDQISIWAWGTSYDHEAHETILTYTIQDSQGTTVLSGTSPTSTVGQNFSNVFVVPQTKLISKPVTVPSTIANGQYTLTVTLTDNDSAETHTRSTSIWIGEYPDILVVNYNSGGCSDTPVEGWDLYGMSMCMRSGHIMVDDLSQLGYKAMLWDAATLGDPSDSDLAAFPLVIWIDAGLSSANTAVLQSYLDHGGHVLLSSSLVGANEGTLSTTDSNFLWNYLHAHYVSLLFQPDHVTGVSGSDFNGLTLNTEYYNLNGNGSRTNFYASELELNEADGSESLLHYGVGDSSSKVAALRVDAGTYRLAYFAFNITGINDTASGNETRAYLLDTIVPWLLGTAPTITDVSKRVFVNNHPQTVTISGTNFSTVGTTTVKLGKKVLSDVVTLDANTITATIPAGVKTGKQTLKVINPDGQKAVARKLIRIVPGGVVVDAVTPSLVTNDGEQRITITGDRFKKTTKIFLGEYQLSQVRHDSPTQLTVLIPPSVLPGTYTLRFKNPHSPRVRKYRGIVVRLGITDTLTVGNRNEQVKALESRLKKLGYFKGRPDQEFTQATKRALLLYQHALGIRETGTTEYLTRHYLNILESTTPADSAE